jgi:hypothetical protein
LRISIRASDEEEAFLAVSHLYKEKRRMDYDNASEVQQDLDNDESWKDDLDEVIDDMDRRRHNEYTEVEKWEDEVYSRCDASVEKTCHDPACVEQRRCQICIQSHHDKEQEEIKKLEEAELEAFIWNRGFGAKRFCLPRADWKISKHREKTFKLRNLQERSARNEKPRRPQRDFRAIEVREVQQLHRYNNANVEHYLKRLFGT